MDIIKAIEHEQIKSKIPELNVGSTVRVHVRVKEGNRERIQVFEGIIIKVQGGGVNQTFTVRRVAYGVGVEKTFLVHSPNVEKVEVVRVGKARRAKLFYLRDREGKKAKTKELVGARIETREIVLKEEASAEETVSEETIENKPETTVTETVDAVKEEATEKVEEAVEEATPATEEVKEAAEEATPVTEEVKEAVEEVTSAEESKEE